MYYSYKILVLVDDEINKFILQKTLRGFNASFYCNLEDYSKNDIQENYNVLVLDQYKVYSCKSLGIILMRLKQINEKQLKSLVFKSLIASDEIQELEKLGFDCVLDKAKHPMLVRDKVLSFLPTHSVA